MRIQFIFLVVAAQSLWAAEFASEILPFIKAHCLECHGGKKVKGKVDFSKIAHPDQLDASFKTWGKAVELLQAGDMPPEENLPPSEADQRTFYTWYENRFVDSIEPRAGPFQPRRLSVAEYRNTMRSLFEFDLELAVVHAEQTSTERSLVQKLLPIDPPGASGFTNDTHSNPLTTETWGQYARLADIALARHFAAEQALSLEEANAALAQFVSRAFRRPATPTPLTAPEQLQAEMKVALMSPAFIYRGLLVEDHMDDFELAERLSYFICGDMPDAELAESAQTGRLGEVAEFAKQINRLLASPGARNLAESFGYEWLGLGDLDAIANVQSHQAYLSQPIDFIHYLFAENRPLTELIESKTSFVSPMMAGHYGKDRNQMKPFQPPKGVERQNGPNQRISLTHSKQRGGIITMPGIAQMNRGPILRGTWILERILGEHLPEPPMDVGSVPRNKKGEKLSFRQRFEQHRSQPSCAVCHDKIDPLGFAMQRFSGSGSYITDRPDDPELDSSGQLPSGERFDDIIGLKRILVTVKRRVVVRNLVERLMSYALCRELEIYDQPTVATITDQLYASEGTFRDLVHAIATSLPFRGAEFTKD
jgi:hypothetical protein